MTIKYIAAAYKLAPLSEPFYIRYTDRSVSKPSTTMTRPKTKILSYNLPVATLIIALLSIYVLLPQLSSFQNSFNTAINANKLYLLLATALFAATYFAASLSYLLIAYVKLPYWPTVLIQVADGFTNRIIPAGLGAIATNSLYLTKYTKSSLKAGYVAILNNAIGLVAHLLILTILLAANYQTTGRFANINPDLRALQLFAGLLIVLFIVSLVLGRLRRRPTKGLAYLRTVLLASIRRPFKLLAGVITAMSVTVLYGLTLFFVVQSLGVELTFLQTFLALTAAVLAMTVTPTPGGLGGVEAGLVAVLISFGVTAGPALSVAITYRFITYWLPIIPGAIALRAANNRGYLAKPRV